jgi:hypothetical protein
VLDILLLHLKRKQNSENTRTKKGKTSNWVFKDRQSEQWVETFLPESAVENLECRGVRGGGREDEEEEEENREEIFYYENE